MEAESRAVLSSKEVREKLVLGLQFSTGRIAGPEKSRVHATAAQHASHQFCGQGMWSFSVWLPSTGKDAPLSSLTLLQFGTLNAEVPTPEQDGRAFS